MGELFGITPINGTASWRSGPDQRGTLSILSTCVITLFLCAYTSLHLNIPEENETQWRLQLKRIFWLLVGLIAPEFLAFIAYREWLIARDLTVLMEILVRHRNPKSQHCELVDGVEPKAEAIEMQDLNVSRADSQRSSKATTQSKVTPTRDFAWTRVHSHFALMGGFAFDTKKLPLNILSQNRTRGTLSLAALRILARHEPNLVPDISVDTIRDKSKANGLAKFIVCLQACWFVVQMVGRLITSSTISMLELNTFLHALCCLAIYIAWWQKPLDIEEPVLIDTSEDRVRQICAWMTMHDYDWRPQQGGPEEEVKNMQWSGLVYDQDIWDVNSNLRHKEKMQFTVNLARDHHTLQTMGEIVDPEEAQWETSSLGGKKTVVLYPGQICHGFRAITIPKPIAASKCLHVYTSLTPANIECLRLVQKLRTEEDRPGLWQIHLDHEETLITRPGML